MFSKNMSLRSNREAAPYFLADPARCFVNAGGLSCVHAPTTPSSPLLDPQEVTNLKQEHAPVNAFVTFRLTGLDIRSTKKLRFHPLHHIRAGGSTMSSRKHTMPETSATFADRIKMLICKVGSVTEIARMCGFSEGVVRSWRDGNTDPSRARCVTLARTLGVSLVWLVAGEGAMQTDSAVNKATDDQTSGETVPSGRHRSRLDAAASTLQTTGMAMDEERLNVALKMLQSELDLSESRLSLADNADLLAELYSILGPAGQDISPAAMMAFNRRLAERVRNSRSAVA